MRSLLLVAAALAVAVLPACSTDYPADPVAVSAAEASRLTELVEAQTANPLSTLSAEDRGKLEAYASMASDLVANGAVSRDAVTVPALVADAELNYGIEITQAQAAALRDQILTR